MFGRKPMHFNRKVGSKVKFLYALLEIHGRVLLHTHTLMLTSYENVYLCRVHIAA